MANKGWLSLFQCADCFVKQWATTISHSARLGSEMPHVAHVVPSYQSFIIYFVGEELCSSFSYRMGSDILSVQWTVMSLDSFPTLWLYPELP